jgi:hypothetical protein
MVIYVIPIMVFVHLPDVNVDRIQHVDRIVREVILFERKKISFFLGLIF